MTAAAASHTAYSPVHSVQMNESLELHYEFGIALGDFLGLPNGKITAILAKLRAADANGELVRPTLPRSPSHSDSEASSDEEGAAVDDEAM